MDHSPQIDYDSNPYSDWMFESFDELDALSKEKKSLLDIQKFLRVSDLVFADGIANALQRQIDDLEEKREIAWMENLCFVYLARDTKGVLRNLADKKTLLLVAQNQALDNVLQLIAAYATDENAEKIIPNRRRALRPLCKDIIAQGIIKAEAHGVGAFAKMKDVSEAMRKIYCPTKEEEEEEENVRSTDIIDGTSDSGDNLLDIEK